MKKIITIFIFILTFISAFNIKKTNAEVNFYAKIESNDVYFYSQSDKSPLFELPYSYFVKVEKTEESFYKCSYNGLEGYVKKNEVVLMNGTPSTPYVDSYFKVFVTNYLYEDPTQTSTIKNSLSTSDKLKYFGKIKGQQISSTSNLWYYCSLEKDGQIFWGYVFSGISDYLMPIQTNNESFEKVDESALSSPAYSQVTTLSTRTKILLIVSIALPSAIILYFLIKPSRIQITRSKKQIKSQKKVRHGDYYEFDENDL